MKKSIWIFLLAVLLPAVVLGWLALRSAEEQKIVFERRTAELYQKETEALAMAVREGVEEERRVFGETVHRLLANGKPDALARDFANTLADAWPRKAVGFVLDEEGKLVSPTAAGSAANPDFRKFLIGNGAFLCSTEPALVYTTQPESNPLRYSGPKTRARAPADYSQSYKADFPKPRIPESTGAEPVPRVLAKIAAPAEPLKNLAGKDFDHREKTPDEAVVGSKPANGLNQGKENAEMAPSNQSAGPATVSGLKQELPGSGPQLEVVSGLSVSPGAFAPPDDARSIQDTGRAQPTAEGRLGKPDAKAVSSDHKRQTVAVAKPSLREATRDSGLEGTESLDPVPPPSTAVPLPQVSGSTWGDEAKKKAAQNTLNRQVEPQQLLGAPSAAWSILTPATADFRALTEDSDGGIVSRFVQDKLDLIFWMRPPEAPEMVFGCLVEAANLADIWKGVIEKHVSSRRGWNEQPAGQPDYVMAVLDDRARPAAIQPASAVSRDWKRPFVASEVGETLPHWEAALYLASPSALADSARGLWRTLSFTIAGAVALMALGGWLVVADVRRQLALAQQKTDFVSNVSHELKTPLTSIRMFAELMHDRPQPMEKQAQYLRIITVEAERLTRLINNVLDFARIGRKQKGFEKKPLDLHQVISHVWDSQGLHLREAGFETRWEAAAGPYPVLGDDDALSQVLVNLLSNAEKYSTGRKEVELHTWIDDGWVNVSVLDRGMGVPDGEERKIFEAFYRAHDSLNSGIQGSGLGLTLAHHVAREHAGEIRFEPRDVGGSRFTLRIPLAKPSDSQP